MALFLCGLATTRINIGRYGEDAALVIPVIVVLLAIRRRAGEAKGALTPLDRVTTGVLTSLAGQAVYLPFLAIYRRFINPDWLEFILQLRRRELLASGGVSFDALEGQITALRSYIGGAENVVGDLMLSVVVLGSAVSLLSLVLIRNRRSGAIPQTQQ